MHQDQDQDTKIQWRQLTATGEFGVAWLIPDSILTIIFCCTQCSRCSIKFVRRERNLHHARCTTKHQICLQLKGGGTVLFLFFGCTPEAPNMFTIRELLSLCLFFACVYSQSDHSVSSLLDVGLRHIWQPTAACARSEVCTASWEGLG